MDNTHKPQRCTAQRRMGRGPCKSWAIRGKDKCRIHGGKTPFKTDGRNSKYLKTIPPLKAQREKIDADPRLASSGELLKKYTTIINQLYEDLEQDLLGDECPLCGSTADLLNHPALKPLLENLATATTKAAAVEELKMKKGVYMSIQEVMEWMNKIFLPCVEDLLLPDKMPELQKRLAIDITPADPGSS